MEFKNIAKINQINNQYCALNHILVGTTLLNIGSSLHLTNKEVQDTTSINTIDASILLLKRLLAKKINPRMKNAVNNKFIKSFKTSLDNLTIIMQSYDLDLSEELSHFIIHQIQTNRVYQPTLERFITDWNEYEAHNELVIKHKKAPYLEVTGKYGKAFRSKGIWQIIGQQNPQYDDEYIFYIDDVQNYPDDFPICSNADMFLPHSNLTTKYLTKNDLVSLSKDWSDIRDYSFKAGQLMRFIKNALTWLPLENVDYVIDDAEDYFDIDDYVVQK